MKKYLGIIVISLLVIGINIIPESVHAMTQQDLGGRAYFTNNPDENNGRTMLFIFNKNASRVYVTVVHKESDGSYKPMIRASEFNKVISSKKAFNKYSYKTKDKEEGDICLINRKGTKMYVDGEWAKVKGDANGFTVTFKNGKSPENFMPAPINVDFEW